MTSSLAAARFSRNDISPSEDLDHMHVRMTMMQQENNALRRSMAHLRTDYEALEEDSKFHKAKVSELEDMLMKKGSGRGKQDERLIYKSQENAELKCQLQSLQAKLRERDSQVETLARENQDNKRLLLEMSDIVRTLSSVKIDYDVSAVHDKGYVGAQQTSIKKIKLKIQAIMSDRMLLVKRCKELEKDVSEKNSKIHSFETQFHVLNNKNLAMEGVVPMDDAATLSTSYTISTKQSGSTATSPPRATNDDSSMDHSVLMRQQFDEQMDRMQERMCEQMNALKEELLACKEEKEDAVIKRDEYKETLRDVLTQYNELHAEVAAKAEVSNVNNQDQAEQEENTPNVKDILAAYNRSLDKIAILEQRLCKAQNQANSVKVENSNDHRYRDAVAAYTKMERERNNYQILLDKAKLEEQKAQQQVKKERLEAQNIRRRLTMYLQGNKTLPLSPKQHPLSLPDLKSPVCPEEMLLEREALLADKQHLEQEVSMLTECCEAMLQEMGA